MIDNFYHLDKSSKRKNESADFCSFCDVEYRKILKHVNTRWLSLKMAITRTLQQYSGLKSYFLSQGNYNYYTHVILSICLLVKDVYVAIFIVIG